MIFFSELNSNICEWFELYGQIAFVLWSFLGFVLGACFGSFTTACVWRIPRGISIVWPPSSCPKCRHTLGLGENIPIFGWLILRGKCKGCGMPISPRYVLIELATAILFALTAWLAASSGVPLQVIPAWTLIVLAIASTCTDCELRMIPDQFTYPAMGMALACSFFLPFAKIPSGMTPLFALCFTGVEMLAVGLFGLSARWGGRLMFKKEALGWGDVKFLMAVAGLTNVLGTLVAVGVGSIFALIWIAFDAVKRGKIRHKFAYGPFLAAGAVCWLLFRPILMKFFLR